MKRRSRQDRQSVEDDRRKLAGLWAQSGELALPLRLLYWPGIAAEDLKVCDFGHYREGIFTSPSCLVERDGMRLMLAYLEENEEVLLFQYTLSGDTLELLCPHGDRPEWWTQQNSYPWDDLVGKWFRVRIDQ